MIIAQISDSHITLKEDADVRLQGAVAHLLELPARPDVVLVTGDCVNTGSLEEYSRFQELLRPLPMPVYVIPGNHDDRAHMLEVFGAQGAQPLLGFVQYVVDVGPLRLIALDTQVPGRGEGLLCAERLGWLDERLSEAPTRPTVVYMHHPPFPTGMVVFDQIGLTGAEDLAAIIGRHPQVERLLAGHVHTATLRRFAGSVVMTCPATAHTMLPDFTRPERLSVLMEPPVCLLHVWRDSSEPVTYTSLIGQHRPLVDLHDGTRWIG